MGILPEKIVRTRGKDSSDTISEIYTLDNWNNLGCMTILLIPALFCFVVFIPAIPAILLLFYCFKIDLDDKPYYLCVIALFLSIYLLYDIHNDNIVSNTISFFYDKNEMHYVINFNFALAITSFIILIFSDFIFSLSGKNNFMSFILICLILLVTYFFSDAVLSSIIKLH
jgi:hypothetical protein